jgi:hypothetical protein
MKAYKWKIGFIMLIVMACMSFLLPSRVSAFDAVKIGDESEVTVYGWIRNNFGFFTEDLSYVQDQDSLATDRTWLRLYGDFKFSDKLSAFTALQLVYEPPYDIEKGSVSKPDGKEYSEYDNINDVLREAYIDWRPSENHSFRIGRQIVIWGESLTTRVGDVIHPEDTRFTFAFANLEDTRIPLWMVKGLHYFDALNGSIEWVISPNINQKEYLVNRSAEFAQPDETGVIQPGQRFGLYPEDRLPAGPPLIRSFAEPFPGAGFMVPFEIPHVEDEYPQDTLDDMRYGFRTSTFLGGYEFGLIYWHTQSYDPVIRYGALHAPPFPGPPPTRDYTLIHPDIDIIGFYGNKDIPVGLLRSEMIYIPDKPYNTLDLTDADAIVERDYIKYMIAWDLNGLFYFPWHKSAPFDVTLEHVGEWVKDADNLQYAIYDTEVETWTPSFNGRISTNFFYNKLATEMIFSYAPKDKSGLFMPVVKYTPSWQNKALSFELRYIRIFGESNYSGLGMLQEKDMVVLTSQFNF